MSVIALACAMIFNLSLGAGLTFASAETDPLTIVYDTDYISVEHGATYVDDTGKSGLKISSVKSGTEAEGTSFSFGNEFTGTFEMDFRVTSEKAYESLHKDSWSHYVTNPLQKYGLSDDMNPYLDLKEMAITFTSNTNADAYFTVYFMGAHTAVAWYPMASVYVNGDDMYLTDETGVKRQYGYGLKSNQNVDGTYTVAGWNPVSDYNNMMMIYGTSFCNFNPSKNDTTTPLATTSNLVKFDPETMKVYVNNSAGYSTWTTANSLLRSLSDNQGLIYDTASASYRPGVAAATLNKDDFANGYTVSVAYTDITSNSTVGNAQNFGGKDHYAKTIETPYDRYANVIFYSVNGVEMSEENLAFVTDVNKVDRRQSSLIEYSDDVAVTENVLNSVDGRRGLNIRSTASGESAEGTGFSFADTMLGEFELDFRVTSKNTYQIDENTSAGWTHYITNGKQQYFFSDWENPYLDLKEVGFTFTSKTDPTKYFTVYMRGTHGDLAFATTAYVYVPGDECYKADENGNKHMGYALSPNGEYPVGSMGGLQDYRNMPLIYGTSFSNYSATKSGDKTPTKTTSNVLRFDAENMKVYVNTGENYSTYTTEANYLVRDLATNQGAKESVIVGSLNAKDFANGYTVSVAFTDMTDNATTGEGIGANGDKFGGTDTNYVKLLPEAYERYADLTLYSVNGQKVEVGNSGKFVDTTSPRVSVPSLTADVNQTLDLTPFYYDSCSGNEIGAYGKVYVATDGETFTEVQRSEDGYLYTPADYGTLTVKYEGFADTVGNVASTTIGSVVLVDYILPELAFKEGISADARYDMTSGRANRPVYSTGDVVITNANNEIKTYTVEIIEVKDPDGQIYKTTFLSFLKDGVYTVTYKVTDSFGNENTIVRKVEAGDFSAPELVVAKELNGYVGRNLDIKPLVLNDFASISMTVTVTKDGKNVYQGKKADVFKPTEEGEYVITYKAVDESGNESTATTKLVVTEYEEVETPAVDNEPATFWETILKFFRELFETFTGLFGGKED